MPVISVQGNDFLSLREVYHILAHPREEVNWTHEHNSSEFYVSNNNHLPTLICINDNPLLILWHVRSIKPSKRAITRAVMETLKAYVSASSILNMSDTSTKSKCFLTTRSKGHRVNKWIQVATWVLVCSYEYEQHVAAVKCCGRFMRSIICSYNFVEKFLVNL